MLKLALSREFCGQYKRLQRGNAVFFCRKTRGPRFQSDVKKARTAPQRYLLCTSEPIAPHLAIRATHVCAYIRPPTSIHTYIHTPYGYQWAHGHRRRRVSCIRNRGGSIYPTMQELRATAVRQADTWVVGVTLCEMWGVEGSLRTSAFV